MNEWLPKFKNEKLLAQIVEHTKGLTYISETDSAIEPYSGERTGTVSVSDLISGETDAIKYEKLSPENFFDRLIVDRDWFGPKEKENAQRFAQLQKLLQENLRDLTVFKIGYIRLDVYVVGLDADNNLIGIKTKAVET
jgi:hypothetical protein